MGMDYPNPIIDHATAGFLCCEKLRSVMDMVRQGPSKVTSSRRTHSNCTSALQTQLQRFHPYSRLEGGNNLVLTPQNVHHDHHHRHGNSSAQNCNICTCTDSLLSQVLSTSQAQDRASGRRLRRKTPPSICSHKKADFAVIT